jgi:GH24 family phage-related lysozyme (muramidase)
MKIIVTESQYNLLIKEDTKSPSVVTTTSSYKKGYDLRGSEWLMNFIRNEEGDPKRKGQPVLRAYKRDGDVWTIGYGHTTGDNEPKVVSGMTISGSKAESIMRNDLTYSADCVRRIFKEWEDKGIDVPITQNMFDVLVSLVYNSGCGSVRMSDFIQSLKKKKYKKTAQQIKTFNLKSGFGGLVNRREIESKRFLE